VPRLISREDALAAIRREGGEPACLMCSILARGVGPVHAVHEDAHALVMLPRYVRSWGSAMVIPKPHVTTYAEIDAPLWTHVNALALHTARVVERVLAPRRCYVASIGSSAGEEELVQSSRHLHVHVIPVHDASMRPADVFSWAAGVLVADAPEWEALCASYRAVWTSSGAPAGS
jgi:diadenosine tetraphosphate (Ap4A) HIT family hydrolase